MAGPGKPGRLAWRPTDEQRRVVEAMSACGVPHTAIAAVLGVNKETLEKHLRIELDTGLHKANARVAQFLYTGILGSATTPPFADEHDRMVSAMFWLKCRANWKETVTHEVIRPVAEMSDEELQVRLDLEERAENVVLFKGRGRRKG